MSNNPSYDEGVRIITECQDFPMSIRAFARLVGRDHVSPRRAAARLGIIAHGRILYYSKETALRVWKEMCSGGRREKVIV